MPPAGKLKLSTVARLFKLILKDNKWKIAIVLLCILVSTLATLASTLFTKTLLDDYVVPMIGQAAPDYSPLAVALVKLAAVLIIGMGASYLHSILTVYISQGTLKTLRHNLFEHMERLPLSYFDSRSHGDIMSVYNRNADLVSIGAYKAGTNPKLDYALQKIDSINEFLIQGTTEAFSYDESVAKMAKILA